MENKHHYSGVDSPTNLVLEEEKTVEKLPELDILEWVRSNMELLLSNKVSFCWTIEELETLMEEDLICLENSLNIEFKNWKNDEDWYDIWYRNVNINKKTTFRVYMEIIENEPYINWKKVSIIKHPILYTNIMEINEKKEEAEKRERNLPK